MNEKASKLAQLVNEIASLHERTAAAIALYDDDIEKAGSFDSLKNEAEHWAKVAYRNALIKLRLLIEQNFLYIETFGMLAVTRYIFEILVWLRCINQNRDYGLVFFRQALNDSIKHLDGQKKQMEDEIFLFESLGSQERAMFEEALARISVDRQKEPQSYAAAVHQAKDFVESEIDARARRSFSLYSDKAKTNGYGFQAFLLRTKGLEQYDNLLASVTAERDAFDKACPPSVLKMAKAKWDWSQRARDVGMQNQYEFLYRYTSRLLHATPTSFFTDQKNLEPPEVIMFLDYVYVSLLDCLELAEKRIGQGCEQFG